MSVRSETCPVCRSAIRPWRVKTTGDQAFAIDRCGTCGYAFVNPRPGLDVLTRHYARLGHGREATDARSVLERERTFPNSTVDAARMLATIGALAGGGVGGRFLDVGCGYGFYAARARAAGFEVIALDLAENERGIAEAIGGVTPLACSFEAFECAPGSIRVVLMSHVLEHAFDVQAWIAKAHRILAEDGLLAVALPNFGSLFRLVMQEREPYVCPPDHLNFFDPGSLGRLLAGHGFAVEAVQWVSRLPLTAFEKRLPALKPVLPLVGAASWACLRLIDGLRLGATISVYARKARP
ncbi:MAG: class I SAM-dependent methyltransferase [Alphaproteobacteria bacterium]|nr:class I SAM-dependent methyltransferase [Alphaproteobacteria bacterium]